VHAEPFYVVPNLPTLKVPLLLVDQTIEFKVYQHFVEKFKYFPLKPLLYFDVFKMKYWESQYWKRADRVVAMSDDDKNLMQELVPNLQVDIVPNGVDSAHFDKKKFGHLFPKPKDPVVLYVGSCTWLQNREAIEVLYKQVWPKILEKLPNAKLWIIGKSAGHFFGTIRSDSVRVDEVEDIREAYFGATVLVAPIYGAGGTRYKNFEAFASGLPIVTTSIGIGGTEAIDGRDVIIKDKPEDLAEWAVKVIKDQKLHATLSENGVELVKTKYDWDSISKHLSQIYQQLGKKHAA
jgi:glycosyltransferase involved in cell wall biosynthesis